MRVGFLREMRPKKKRKENFLDVAASHEIVSLNHVSID